MAFQKGQTRPPGGGRKPGSKNKKTLFRAKEILAERERNPVDEILRIVDALDPIDQVHAWLKLLEYCEGKAKSIEDNGDDADSDLLEEFEGVSTESLLKVLKSSDEVS